MLDTIQLQTDLFITASELMADVYRSQRRLETKLANMTKAIEQAVE